MRTLGIHHITAIAGAPQSNIDFYCEVLGLRLVKRTINFDDPGSYHFYFGDNIGTPGTIITFFPWPGAHRGTRGSGQVTAVGFVVPRESLPFWQMRLRENRISAARIASRFGESVIRFVDPDGLLVELVATEKPQASTCWEGSRISPENEIRGFAPPTLELTRTDLTEKLLREVLGFIPIGEEGKRRRYAGSGQFAAAQIDVVASDIGLGRIAVGSVHHIAFRASDDDEQRRWRKQLVDAGFGVTPIIDRNYFHSIYFREPGGILFEIATDGPGFAIDESVDTLGETLKLPSVYEPMRGEIERALPPIELPALLVK